MWGWIVAAFVFYGVLGAVVMSCLAASTRDEKAVSTPNQN